MEKQIYEQFYQLEESHWWFKGMYGLCYQAFASFILPHMSKKCSIVDIGCGNGTWSSQLTSHGSVIGADYSSQALHNCCKRGLTDLIQTDAQNLPIENSSCQAITALGLIEHLDNDRTFLKEVNRVLSPGGHALFLTSAYTFLWGEHDDLVHHKRRYTKSSFTSLLKEAGFEIVKISYANTFLFIPILLMRLLEKCGLRRKHSPQDVSADLFLPAPFVNKLLFSLLKMESRLLKKINLPCGVSLYAIVKKRA